MGGLAVGDTLTRLPADLAEDDTHEQLGASRSVPVAILSQAPVTLGAVSNKRSDYGSLTERTGGRSETGRSAVDRISPAGVHVWVRTDAAEVAGLLAGWRRQADGAWWGRVILVTDGQPSETLIRADLLRKAT